MRHLSRFTGILQVDGYSASTDLVKTRAKTGSNETAQLAGCWGYLRRKFCDLHISGISQAATDAVPAITDLWHIEGEVRGKIADSRTIRPHLKSSAMVAGLFELRGKELGKFSRKSKTAEPVRAQPARSAGTLSDGPPHRDQFHHRRTIVARLHLQNESR